MKRIGVCFGGYAPYHRGHFWVTMSAKKHNDITYVIVCGYENEPRTAELGINLNKKYQLIKELFKDDELIKVIKINDTELGIDDESMSMNNWHIWMTDALNKISAIEGNLNCELTFYVGEEKYFNTINEIGNDISNCKYHGFEKRNFKFGNLKLQAELVSRADIDVSATAIRQNPQKYWNYIVKPFRRYLTKNILIIGTASEGKTTLTKDIAKFFNIPCIEEYGRTYMEKHNMLDTDLQYHDFEQFLIHQREELFKAEDSDANSRGVIISDTDNLITLMYAKAYENDENIGLTKEESENLQRLVKEHLIKGVHWDAIFIIPPGNKFVDDGTRYMNQSSIDERMRNYQILLELIKEITPNNINKIIELKPSDYYGNFVTVKNYIESLYV